MKPQNESEELLVEKYASVLDQYKLTHLEYQDESIHIILKRDSANEQSAVQGKEISSNDLRSSSKSNSQDDYSANASTANTQTTGNQPIQGAEDEAALQMGAIHLARADMQAQTVISAPLVGLAYRAKEPGGTPFVQEGDTVEEGDVLCLIEAMKMFNEVRATSTGTIGQILFEDGELVEFGAPLFSLDN